MFKLKELFESLPGGFSQTEQDQQRNCWFAYTMLGVTLPFTSSMRSNLLGTLRVLFRLEIKCQWFYAFTGKYNTSMEKAVALPLENEIKARRMIVKRNGKSTNIRKLQYLKMVLFNEILNVI